MLLSLSMKIISLVKKQVLINIIVRFDKELLVNGAISVIIAA